jgi:hypothetical protein
MELVKNIFFNTDRLTANSTVKISYTGKFFQDGSEKVSIRYGFGQDWANTIDAEMTKTELGFQIEIDLIDSETFNFCVKNEKDEWDNNDGNNYVFNIEHPETALMVLDENKSIKHLRKTYIWSKKIKLAIYKLIISIPKLLTGNYKKTPESNN